MTTALLIGRFQPFHNGHLEVVKKILGECEGIIIAIGSSQYSHTKENPFTGGERLSMISEALADEDIPRHKYTVIPLPDVNNNSLWVSHVKAFCPHFDVVYTQNLLSKRLFEEANITVRGQPMFDRHKYSGTEIREQMINEEGWESHVPKGVAKVIKKVGGVQRLKSVVNVN